ncbi:MAG: type I polyketide synthase, partial [Chitinophaga rupis]
SSAQKLADVSPRSISYIEAHGTGTKLGDPVEIRGLNEAFKVGGSDKFCAIGSVKTNMGHLDVAAGVAGLIKTALALKYKQIPASLHFKAPNPEVDFKGGPFYVNTRLKEWVRNGNSPLRAGVSSFGIGGTNVHAILEEAPEQEASGPSGSYKLLSLSAKTSASLFRYIDALKDFLLSEQTVNVSDLAYTLQVGRKHFVYRRPIVYKNKEELIGLLDAAQSGGQAIKSREQRHAVVFMFPGQGSQYVSMGKGLYLTEPLFRQYIDSGFSILEKLTGEDYKAVLFSETTGRTVIDETRYTQPLIFLLEYSLARLMMSIGVIPDYMIGHSIGEYVAACISGIFSFEEGLRLVVKRGELMNSLPPGSMLSVPITAEEAGPYLGSGISLAAINGPGQVVLSGEITAVEELMSRLNESGIPYIKLHTSHAFHSDMQDPILESFRNEVQKIALREPTISFVSNLTGGIAGKEEALSSDYWVNHLRKTVRFSDGLKTILSSAQDLVFIEVGAGRSLTALLQQQGKPAPLSVNLIRSFKETEEDAKYFITRLGELWANGVAVDWGAYYKEEQRRRISLPTYCFEPARYPAEVNPFETGLLERLQVKTDWELKDWIYYPSWKRTVLYTAGARAFGRGYLFFSSDGKFSDSLKKELLKNGNEVVEVLMGETYKKLSVNRYIIDPVQPDHIKRLVRESGNDQVVLTDIIYSWGIGVDSSRLIWEKDNRELSLVYFSLVAIVQALAQENFLKGKRIAVLTDALHKVIGVENGSYAQSLLLGLVNVVVQECPVSCINIDVNLNEYMQGGAEKLVEEINNNDGRQGRITALRNGQRWVQDFQLNPGPAQQERTFVKPGGVYWITGGLGNVGFVLAKHLVKEYGVKLLLTGRKSINERKNGVEENKEEWLRRLDYLMSIGENVKYIKADMSKPEELNRAVAEAENEWGPILGVIHTAGLLDKKNFELIEDMTVDGAMAVLEPKVRGIENIYQLFKDRHPDFVWITSSLATVLGGLGFGA